MNPTAPGITSPVAPAVGSNGTGQQEKQVEYLTRAEAVEFEKRLRAIELCVQGISEKDREIEDKIVRNALDSVAYAFEVVQAYRREHEQSLKDMAIQKDVTPMQEPASPRRPKTLEDDPLLLLVTGPMSGEEMLADCVAQIPWIPEYDHQLMLEDLYNQYNKKKSPLVPNWWKGSPNQFVQKLNDNLTPHRSSKREPVAWQQSVLLETLLSMQDEAHFAMD